MTTLDFEDYFEAGLDVSVNTKSKFTKIKKPATKKRIAQNAKPQAIAKKIEKKKKLDIAKQAKKKAIVAAHKAVQLKRAGKPAKAKVLAAKATTLNKSADKLQRTVNVDAQRATPRSSTSPVKVSKLKTIATVVKKKLEEKPSTPKVEAKLAKLEVIEDKLNKEIAVQAAPIVEAHGVSPIMPSDVGAELNKNIIQKLDVLEKQILNEQNSKFRRRVLGKLDSLQRRVNSSGLGTRGVYA